MDNYSHTPGPDKKSAKRLIAIKLKKNKSDWKYVSDDDIENTVNNMIDNMYPNKDDNYCLGSGLGWAVSVEKILYKNGINEMNELNEKKKKEKEMIAALTLSLQGNLPVELLEEVSVCNRDTLCNIEYDNLERPHESKCQIFDGDMWCNCKYEYNDYTPDI